MIGNSTVTSNRSLMARIQARCEKRLSTDTAINSQPIAENRSEARAIATNSLVHTGVKSAGCENRASHRPQIARASCRESVCHYVSISVVAVSSQTKKKHKQ